MRKMKRKKSNPQLTKLIETLESIAKKEKVKLWRRLAKDLEKPTRHRREVNLSRIDRYLKEDETAVVPGKVLSAGNLSKNSKVAAWKFSDAAKEKINKIGKAISIEELIGGNPKGKKVRIIG